MGFSLSLWQDSATLSDMIFMAVKNLSNVQMLRAFAALNVIFFHVVMNAATYGFGTYSPTSAWQNWGTSGVDIFFVISGFIMVYMQYHNAYSPSRFFLNRVIRIIPLYWVLTFIIIFLHLFVPSAFLKTHFSLSWMFNSLFLTSKFFENRLPMIVNGWTLEFEMVFYLLFSISLLLSRFRNSVAAAVVFILVFAVITGYTIMYEFLFGMIVGVLFINKKIDYKVAAAVFWIGVASYLLSAIFYINEAHRVWVWGVPSMLIVFGLVNLPQYKNALLCKLGDASYSIYLFQFFVILPFYKIVSRIHAGQQFDIVYMLLCFLLTVFAGYLVYLFAELKLTSFFREIRVWDTSTRLLRWLR